MIFILLFAGITLFNVMLSIMYFIIYIIYILWTDNVQTYCAITTIGLASGAVSS